MMHVHHLRFMGLRCGQHIFLRLTGCFCFCLAYAAANSVSGQRWVMNSDIDWRFMGLRCGRHIFLRLTGCFSFCLAYAAADSVSGKRWVMNSEWVLMSTNDNNHQLPFDPSPHDVQPNALSQLHISDTPTRNRL